MKYAELSEPRGHMPDETDVQRQTEARVSPRLQSNSDVVLICPNEAHRRTLLRALVSQHANILSQLPLYPAYNHLLSVIDLECDCFVIEADTDPAEALNLVEAICDRKPTATVMVYSSSPQPDLLISSMRAGAREFLTGNIAASVLNEALLRATARRVESSERRVRGKVLAFWGAKGGSGVTTLATNFAIALKQETNGEVALVDLNPHLGDIAVLLGLTPRFTISDALANPERLDKDFVATLMTADRTGVQVMSAPDAFTSTHVSASSVGKLLDLVAAQFPYVVVDAGVSLGEAAGPLFQIASTIYLVTQTDVPSLRSSQRFANYLRTYGTPNVELTLNRYESRRVQFDDDQLGRTIGLGVKWKVPNDFGAARRAADTGSPVIMDKSTIAESLRRMARAACGRPVDPSKKKTGLFG